MVWILLGAMFLLIWLAWKFLPVGKVHGRKVMLGELRRSNTRLQLKYARAEELLKKCLLLPPHERLAALVGAEERFGGLFLIGDKIRKALVATGASGAAVHFKRILRTPTGGTIFTSGLRDALGAPTEEDYRVQAFKVLVDGLDHSEMFSVSQSRIADLLLQLDKEWALRLLRSPEYLNAEHDLFQPVLSLLNEEGVEVDLALITAWMSHYGNRQLELGEGLEYLEVLKALYVHDEKQSTQLIEKVVEEQGSISSHAFEALFDIRDLPHPTFSLDDLHTKVGFDALSYAEKTVWLVHQYAFLMSLEGLLRMHWDSRADQMVEMREALHEVGAANHAAQLDAYMFLYGPGGAPKTVSEREAVTEAAGESWPALVGAVVERFDHLEDASSLGMRYALNHRDQIRKRSEIRQILTA